MSESKQQIKLQPQFSTEFLSQLGIPAWCENPAFFHRPVEIQSNSLNSSDVSSSGAEVNLEKVAVNANQTGEFSNTPIENQPNHPVLLKEPLTEEIEETSEKVIAPETSSVVNKLSTVQVSRVFIANGVDEIWQNEESTAWQLWENILLAFGWQESEIEFFDAATMVTEESLFDCMEAVMELPIDQVFVMLDEHPIVEMLQEGLEVVHLPGLDEMLDDPYAKQRFYQSVIQYA